MLKGKINSGREKQNIGVDEIKTLSRVAVECLKKKVIFAGWEGASKVRNHTQRPREHRLYVLRLVRR